MKIISFRSVYGPNVYHYKPVIIMKLDLEDWSETPTKDIPNFNEKLLALLPGVSTHGCSRGYDGGFLERLNEGTYLAHVIEHVALEISTLSGINVTFGKARYAGKPGIYNVIVRLENKSVKLCLETAVDIANTFISGSEYLSLDEKIKHIRDEASKHQLGPSSAALVKELEKRNMPFKRLGNTSILQIGYGKNIRFLQTAVSGRTSLISTDLVQDKDLTKSLLHDNAIPVPAGTVVSSLAELKVAAQNMDPPYVVKPYNGNHGNGVSLNLKTFADLERAFHIAKEFSCNVIVEEMCFGRDYRILVIDGKFVAAAERTCPTVVGNGISSVSELIDEVNLDPNRGDGHDKNLTKIVVDDLLLETLKKQGLMLSSVLKKDHRVVLKENANLSSGGTSEDVTDKVHESVKTICERIARIVHLDICGIDVIHSDLSSPVDDSFKVIEVNAGPGLRMHLAPSKGTPRNVAALIVDMIYPNNKSARIPIVSITGTNGKTTVSRLVSKMISINENICVGTTSTDYIEIGGKKILEGDTTGPQSAQIVLSDPSVDCAVLEVARGGILRGGLSYDWADIGIVTNIREDHFGQDGIEDIDDLVWIKSLVAERVKEDGWLVLNADDEQSLALRNSPKVQKVKKNIFLYSLDASSDALSNHLLAGGSAGWVDRGWFYYTFDNKTTRLLKTEDAPITMGGIAHFQISNILAAIGAAAAMGLSAEQIKAGVLAFQPATANLGRLNCYKVKEGYVILDYGHNPDAMQAIGDMLKPWETFKKTAIISLPGDRTDALIRKSAKKIAFSYDHFIFKEDSDLRGRKPGEVSAFLEKEIRSLNDDISYQTILDEAEALQATLSTIGKNEFVVAFYEDFENIMNVVRQFDPIPVTTLPKPEKIDENHSNGNNVLSYPSYHPVHLQHA